MKTIQEIERRFIVKSLDPDIQRQRSVRIVQGYFDTPPHVSLRVRITDDARAELTRKTGSGIERQETTQPTDLETGRFLFESCADALSKTRYFRDGKKALLLDRGTVDGAAYMDGGLDEFGKCCRTSGEYEYSQYDLVICLAPPPAKVYKEMSKNNPARGETYEQAEALGKRIKKVWCGHPRFLFIPDSGSWEAKARAVKKAVMRFLAE